MKGNPNVIKHLNNVLRNELTAINQYFLHSKILRFVGFTKLADYEYKESIDEMKHADSISTRILFLGGLPNFQDMGKLLIGETPEEILKADLKAEEKAHQDLIKAIEAAGQAADSVTVNLLEDILASEEDHIDWLRKQLHLMKTLGVENYLQTQV